jgi:hypothetical protein
MYTAYVGGLSNTTVTEEDIRGYFGYDNVSGGINCQRVFFLTHVPFRSLVSSSLLILPRNYQKLIVMSTLLIRLPWNRH